MSNNELNNSKKDYNKAEEPEAAYSKSERKTITISNLKELKELDRAHTANLSPPQRMKYLRKLNENVFGFDLSRQASVLRKGEITIKEEP